MQTLLLNIIVGPDDGLQILPALVRNGGGTTVLPLCEKQARKDAVLQLAGRILGELQQAGAAIASRGEDAARAFLTGNLQPLGRELTDQLLDPWLIELMCEPRQVAHVGFWIDPRLNGVPFECAFLEQDFLGFLFATGREVISKRRRRLRAEVDTSPSPYQALVVINPTADLPGAIAAEYATFHEAWLDQNRDQAVRFSRPGTIPRQRLLDLLGQHEFVNLVGHHRYVAADPAHSGFPLPGGDLLSASDLVQRFQDGPGRPPALVFSMGCESGLTQEWANWPDGPAIHGLVDAALQAGIRHYVGTLIKFPAHPGGRFFEPFYSALAEGRTVGEAVRRARLSFRAPGARHDWRQGGTALGLSLIAYGDPAVPYFSAGGQRVSASPTVLCEETEGAGFCGRAARPEDRGFAQRRCVEHARGLACSAGHPVRGPSELRPCSKCANTVCERCSGSGKGLCWEHCCFEGHETAKGAWEPCPDPEGHHPGLNRSVCPLDRGWQPGGPKLCREC